MTLHGGASCMDTCRHTVHTRSMTSSGKNYWHWGTNNGTRVYLVREGARRWAVWTKGPTKARGGDRWGHFRLMRDGQAFARAVVDGRAFTAEVGLRMVVDPAHGGRP